MRKKEEAEKEKRKRRKARKAAKAAKAAETAITEGPGNEDQEVTDATKAADALLRELLAENVINGTEGEDEQHKDSQLPRTQSKVEPSAGSKSIVATSELEAVKDTAAGKPVDHVSNDDARPHADDGEKNHEQLLESIPMEHNLEQPDNAGKPALEVTSNEIVIPQTPTSTAKESPNKVSPTLTLDGKPYPRNRPCPCGSRHKFKKCQWRG